MRHRRQVGLAVGLGLGLVLGSAVARAAGPPRVDGVSPLGLRRGFETSVTVKGADLGGHPRLVAPFVVETAEGAGNSDPAGWRVRLKVDLGTAVGVYPVRVQTDEGLSAPFLLAVGQLPEVAEVEENSTFEAAQVVALPAVVEGQAGGSDVDFFRFPGRKGMTLVVDAQCARVGSSVDPSVRLTTAGRTFVASADDTPGLVTDARLVAVLPVDGDYVVELSDTRYQGGPRPVYRLTLGEVPVADEVYPLGGRSGETVGLELRGGTMEGVRVAATRVLPSWGVGQTRTRVSGAAVGLTGPASALDVESLPPMEVGDMPELREPADPAAPPVTATVPVAFDGRIDPAGDEDRWVLAVSPGQRLRVEVEASEFGSSLDGVLQALNPAGAVLATADDTPIPLPKPEPTKTNTVSSPDPRLDLTVPAGLAEVTLVLRDLQGRGGVGFPYRIIVRPAAPGFEVRLNEAQASVPRGGTAAVGLTAVRGGENGPITVRLADPPAGLSSRPAVIPEGQTAGVLTLTAAADAAFGPVALAVIGVGPAADGKATARATRVLEFSRQTMPGANGNQQATLATNALTQTGLVVAPASALPASVETPEAPVEVAHGFKAAVPVKITRTPGAEGPLAFTLVGQPTPGLALAALTADPAAAEATLSLATTVEVPVGLRTLAIVAKGKLAGADRVLNLPALALRVVRPLGIEVAPAAVEVRAGASAELKGKVLRRGGFAGPVTLKVGGLPAGLKAEPDGLTLAPEVSEFALRLVADAKAAPATAELKVAAGFQVDGKEYPAPPASAVALKLLPAP